MASGFKINKQRIRQMTREIEREFAKNPVRIPLEADASGLQLPPATTVNNYHGPVVTVTGDNAQLAWNNRDVSQTQSNIEQVAPGYEALADLVTRFLASLPTLNFDPEDEAEAHAASDTVLREVVKAKPDRGVVKRSITILKGLLAPIASGLSQAMTEETTEMARHMVDALGNVLPS